MDLGQRRRLAIIGGMLALSAPALRAATGPQAPAPIPVPAAIVIADIGTLAVEGDLFFPRPLTPAGTHTLKCSGATFLPSAVVFRTIFTVMADGGAKAPSP